MTLFVRPAALAWVALAAAPAFCQAPARPVLKQRLKNGELCAGTFLALLAGGPAAQFLAAQRTDYFILDLEHYVFGDMTVRETILGARLAGIAALIRVPEANEAAARWLDLGADGIVIPSVETAAQAEALARCCRYPPEGARGISMTNGHTNFARVENPKQFLADRNRDVLLMAMIESPKGMENLDAILSVPGLDGAIMGTGDYALAIGLPGQPDHPRVRAAADRFAAACRAKGKLCSVPVRRPEDVSHWVKAGITMLSFVDLSMLGQAIQSNLNAIQKARSELRPLK